MMLPTRTAREEPTMGSQGAREGMLRRVMAQAYRGTEFLRPAGTSTAPAGPGAGILLGLVLVDEPPLHPFERWGGDERGCGCRGAGGQGVGCGLVVVGELALAGLG